MSEPLMPITEEAPQKEEQKITLGFSENLTAFAPETIGSKVVDREKFLAIVAQAVAQHDASKDRALGQHFVSLPAEALECVSAGIGRKTANANDYVLRAHRGKVSAYLKREHAEPTSSVAAIVFTRDAYMNDPDVKNDPKRIEAAQASGSSHVIVAVLASAGPSSPLTETRFIHNLSGGNNEALTWTAEEIRAKADQIKKYWETYDVVAD